MLLEVIIRSAPGLLCALAIAAVLTLAFWQLRENRKIYKLGKRASVVKSNYLGIEIFLSPWV